jgi:predicted enzyme related to lactoylglutathione lyase
MITAVTHLTLYVNDQNEALKFYTEKLGFEVHTDANFENMRWLTINPKGQKNFELSLFPATTPAEKALVGKQAAENVLICLATDAIDADYKMLKEKGVQFIGEPNTEPWGRAVLCKDLYGNGLYLVQAAK